MTGKSQRIPEGQLIFGIHPVNAVLHKAPGRVLSIHLSNSESQRLAEVEVLALGAGLQPQRVSTETLSRMTEGAHQGVVARVRPLEAGNEVDLERMLTSRPDPLFLVLDAVQDPRNLGACLRSAECAGADAVIAGRKRSVSLTPAARKTASGAAEFQPYIQVSNLDRTLKLMSEAGVFLVGAAAEAGSSLYEVALSGSLGLVLGAEGAGLRRLTRARCDLLAGIPMVGALGSLNVSVAAGIFLFEAQRQRQLQ
ncbi:MAG: 23S rRNA (guanosine(2251)-2'-O)-methyltransferase RlmB [Gammaproteobacteria bacterium]|nr:23S rRNA (guanosine(2251)-2'-O)-methyltransferase RlmB [Gammaproteobacteria bacterium]